MAQAYECDVTGAVCKGEPQRFVDVDISPSVFVRALVFVRQSKQQAVQGEIGPEGAKVLEAALRSVAKGARGK